MGRKLLDPAKRKSNLFNFTVSEEDKSELIPEIYKIAKRENITFGEAVVRALREYSEEHKLNNQTLLRSFLPGAPKSENQMVSMYVQGCIDQGLKEVLYRDIIIWLRENDIHKKNVVKRADEISLKLHYNGIIVSRPQ